MLQNLKKYSRSILILKQKAKTALRVNVQQKSLYQKWMNTNPVQHAIMLGHDQMRDI